MDAYKNAIERELNAINLTIDNYPDAESALRGLIDWHVKASLDLQVSKEAREIHNRAICAATSVTKAFGTSKVVSDIVKRLQDLHK